MSVGESMWKRVCEAEKMISKEQFQLKTIIPIFTMLADIEDCVQFHVAKKAVLENS